MFVVADLDGVPGAFVQWRFRKATTALAARGAPKTPGAWLVEDVLPTYLVTQAGKRKLAELQLWDHLSIEGRRADREGKLAPTGAVFVIDAPAPDLYALVPFNLANAQKFFNRLSAAALTWVADESL